METPGLRLSFVMKIVKRTDSQGKFIYSEKDLSKKGSRKQSVTLNPGDVVLSKPGSAHSMKFLENTEFLAITTEPREQDEYEKDLLEAKYKEISSLSKDINIEISENGFYEYLQQLFLVVI